MKKLLMIIMVFGISFSTYGAYENEVKANKTGEIKFTDCASTLCLDDRSGQELNVGNKKNKKNRKSSGRGVMSK